MSYELLYLIKIGGNEGDGITSSCHPDETTVHSVPHWSVLIHTMEQVTQPMKKLSKCVNKNLFLFVPCIIFSFNGKIRIFIFLVFFFLYQALKIWCSNTLLWIYSQGLLKTHSCIRREGLSPSLNFTSFSQRLSMRASCFSVSRINSRDTILFITLSTSAGGQRDNRISRVASKGEHHFRCVTNFYNTGTQARQNLSPLFTISSWPTFIIILEANVTCLNDLCQIYMKSTFSVFFWYIGSFCLDVSSQFRGLVKKKKQEQIIDSNANVKTFP